MARVLVTGGAGFIGSRLCARLAADGWDVVAADVLHPQVHPDRVLPPEFPDGCEFVPFDVAIADPWEPLLRRAQPDCIVHLAAETGTGQSLSEASRHASVNVLGTTRMLDAAYRLSERPRHFVLTSSRAVYGDGAWASADGTVSYPGTRTPASLRAGQWDHVAPDGGALTALASIAGTTQTHPTNVYAATKLAQEHILESWCAATETALSILRLQNVYGPGQSITNSYTGVLTFFARAAIAHDVIDVYEDGEIIRDFVFVGDVVDALAAAVSSPPATKRLLDIGSGAATTIAAAAKLMADAAGAPAPKVSGRFREGDVRAASCSIDAARADLGYAPATDLATGVGQLLSWVAEAEQ
ncbi:MAG: NAD-dependent epimerase/dehydratase family protein [Acidimicrobiia bacterium]